MGRPGGAFGVRWTLWFADETYKILRVVPGYDNGEERCFVSKQASPESTAFIMLMSSPYFFWGVQYFLSLFVRCLFRIHFSKTSFKKYRENFRNTLSLYQ